MKTLEEIRKIREEKRKELNIRVDTSVGGREKHILVCHGTGCTSSKSTQVIENFKKIYELRNELVKIMTDESIVNIKGNNLYVEYMNDSDIKIIGNLSEVKLSEV